MNSGEAASKTVIEEVRSVLTVGTAKSFHGLTCGPNVESSSSLIIVEGRNDVRNLLNCGVKNAISADGSGNIKQELIDLANGKESVTVAIDGDRGGEMLFMQLYDMMKVDHVAQAPVGQEWNCSHKRPSTMCLQEEDGSCQVQASTRQENRRGRPKVRWRQRLGQGHGRGILPDEPESAPADIQNSLTRWMRWARTKPSSDLLTVHSRTKLALQTRGCVD